MFAPLTVNNSTTPISMTAIFFAGLDPESPGGELWFGPPGGGC